MVDVSDVYLVCVRHCRSERLSACVYACVCVCVWRHYADRSLMTRPCLQHAALIAIRQSKQLGDTAHFPQPSAAQPTVYTSTKPLSIHDCVCRCLHCRFLTGNSSVLLCHGSRGYIHNLFGCSDPLIDKQLQSLDWRECRKLAGSWIIR